MKRLSLVISISAALLAACGNEPTEDGAVEDRCSVHLRPSGDDQLMIQSALIEASAGSVLCFDAGLYHLTDGLSLSVPGIGLRAEGGPAVLDFSGQVADAPGIDVTGDDVSIDGLDLRNTAGDALRLVQVDNVRLRRLRISWSADAPPVADAHGISILGGSNVMVSDVRVRSAAAEGISIIASSGVSIRRSSIQESGGGIGVEGSLDVELVGNRLRNNAEPSEAEGSEPLEPSPEAAVEGDASSDVGD